MSEEWIVCTADIRNRIHEAGIFQSDERIVLTTKNCVLLEHFTGKTYSYRMQLINGGVTRFHFHSIVIQEVLHETEETSERV